LDRGYQLYLAKENIPYQRNERSKQVVHVVHVDYVSELQSSADLLFIPQVKYEYGDEMNDTDRENLRTPRNSTRNVLGVNPGLRGEKPATIRRSNGTVH
jgi:hypothetical protein